MPPSILAKFLQRFADGILKTTGEKWIDGIAILFTALYQWFIGKPANFWETITPLVWIVCFILTVHVLIAIVLVWKEIIKTSQGRLIESPIYLPSNKKQTAFVHDPVPSSFRSKLVIIGFFSLGLLVLAAYFVRRAGIGTTSTGTAILPTAALPITHTLLVRYTQGILPIRIAPHDTAYILQLNPNIPEWVWVVPNYGDRAITWPDLHPKKVPPGDFIYACQLTNDEDKSLLDVSISFGVSFHQLEKVPVTVKKNKDGTESITVPSPGTDHVVVTLGHPKYAKDMTAARDGAIVKKFTHSVTLPSIGPGSTAKIYLVNQSTYISKFTFPQQATGIVAGNAQPVQIALIRPNVTVEDALPWYGLAPSTRHWAGVPGSP